MKKVAVLPPFELFQDGIFIAFITLIRVLIPAASLLVCKGKTPSAYGGPCSLPCECSSKTLDGLVSGGG